MVVMVVLQETLKTGQYMLVLVLLLVVMEQQFEELVV